MPLFEPFLHSFMLVNGFADSPFVILALAALGAYLGKVVVETVPYTKRIIERREAAAREAGR